MRTTVTLDPDLAARLKQVARERGISFKKALNDAVRAGLAPPGAKPSRYRLKTYPMGLRPGIDLDRALRLADAIEDEAILRKLELRK